jgi:hypothetical protein
LSGEGEAGRAEKAKEISGDSYGDYLCGDNYRVHILYTCPDVLNCTF